MLPSISRLPQSHRTVMTSSVDWPALMIVGLPSGACLGKWFDTSSSTFVGEKTSCASATVYCTGEETSLLCVSGNFALLEAGGSCANVSPS
jgi:hypothetical protein